MRCVEFCYWLQGFFEISGAKNPGIKMGMHEAEVEMVKKHLNMVFIHDIDPSYPPEMQGSLNAAHSGKKPAIGGVDPITGEIQRC